MRNPIFKVAIASLLGALLALLYFEIDNEPSSKIYSRTDHTPGDKSISGKAPKPRASRTKPEIVYLPDATLPLRRSVDDLERAVRDGSARAACRLAAEYTACANLEFRTNQIDNFMTATGKRTEGSLGSIKLPGNSRELLIDAEHCKGIPTPSPAKIISLWRTAALRGHLPSMVHYATGGAFDNRVLLESLDALALYKTEAPELAANAAASGDAHAILALAAAYSPYTHDILPSMLSQTVEPDLIRSLSLYIYFLDAADISSTPGSEAHEFVSRKIAQLERMSSLSQQARARAEAMRLRSEWVRPDTSKIVSFGALGRGRTPGIEAHDCLAP